MSIVDALTKAKKLAEENRARERVPSQASVAEPVHRIVAESMPRDITRIQPTTVKVDFPHCAEQRLLVPGWETSLDASVESSFRMLRTRVLQKARAHGWRTIGITSASPEDGKTTTALNLSFSLAREKNSDIVLLDLDMRNPSIFSRLGIEPAHHIRDYFDGNAPADSIFVSIGIENLLLAGGVLRSERSSELLSTKKFEELIEYVTNSTAKPLIIIDLPPVLSTDDALVLAPRLDAILLVASEAKTEREQLQRAVNMLSEFRLAGFVLNRTREAVQSYYGYK